MGILSSLKNVVMKFGAAITKPAPIIATAITSPVAFIKNPNAAVEKFVSQPLSTQVIKGAIAGATLGVVAAGKAVYVVKAAVSLLPKSPILKIAAVPAALVTYGAVTTNPKGAAEKVYQAAEASIDLGETISKPSVDNFKEYVEEHPYATAAITATAAAVAAKLIIPTVQSFVASRQTEAIQEQTKAYKEQTQTISAYQNPTPQTIFIKIDELSKKAEIVSPTTPTTSATLPITEDKKTIVAAPKKKKKAKKKVIKKKTKKKAKKKPKKKATKKTTKKKKKSIKRRKSK